MDFTVYAIHTDHLGTPIAMTDDSGTVVWTHRFSPFGETLELNEDPDNDGESISLNLRFPGQYYDSESGLHYNWWRYYEPGTGMYLQSDFPFRILSGKTCRYVYDELHKQYIYVGQKPLIFSDIFGLTENYNCESSPWWDGIKEFESRICTWIPPLRQYACLLAPHSLERTCEQFRAQDDPEHQGSRRADYCYEKCMEKGDAAIKRCCKPKAGICL